MNNPFKKDTGKVIIPIVIGAAVVSAVCYVLLSENCTQIRKSLSDSLIKGWNTIKENNPV